jgi:hypothetical protein
MFIVLGVGLVSILASYYIIPGLLANNVGQFEVLARQYLSHPDGGIRVAENMIQNFCLLLRAIGIVIGIYNIVIFLKPSKLFSWVIKSKKH